MALSLPTTSNTTGSWSNAAYTSPVQSIPNLSTAASIFSPDSNFKYSNNFHVEMGDNVKLSANGDYAVVSTRAAAAGESATEGGVVTVWTRSGNTWSQQASLTNQSGVSSSVADYYGHWDLGPRYNHSVNMDETGEKIIISGPNYNTNSTAGRIEIWERSGSTWTMVFGDNGGSGNEFGKNGAYISGDGNSAIVAASTYLKRYVRSGGSWSIDSAHGTYTPTNSSSSSSHELWGAYSGLGYNNNGTKYAWAVEGPQGTNRVHTRYYDGSSWQTANTTTFDFSNLPSSSYNTAPFKFVMSKDGNYAFCSLYDRGWTGNGNMTIAFMLAFKWNSSTNMWDQDAELLPSDSASGASNQGMPGVNGNICTNYDGSKFIALGQVMSGGSDTYDGIWTWERTGDTWSTPIFYSHPGGSSLVPGSRDVHGGLSSDGKHLLVGIPVVSTESWYDGSSKRPTAGHPGYLFYAQPTGVIVSSVSNGQIATHQGRRFRYNSAKQRWTPANKVNLTGVTTSRSRSAGVASSSLSGETLSINGLTVDVGEFAGKTTTYANASIFPFSSLQAGDQAIALDTGYLYVTDGSGWFRVANSAIVT